MQLTGVRLRFLSLLLLGFVQLTAFVNVHAQDPTGVIRKDTRDDEFPFERLGTLHALVPTSAIKSVVIFVDGDGGWNDGIVDMAQLLANQGALVVGVDTVPYMAELAKSDAACVSIADDFRNLAQAIEDRYNLSARPRPIIVGYSSGATVVYSALAQGITDDFRGGISLGFCTTLELNKPLCPGRSLASHRTKEGLKLLPMRSFRSDWFILQGAVDQACTLKEVSTFVSGIPSAHLVVLPKVGHGFAVARRWHPEYVAAYKKLAAQHSATPNTRKAH
jgi:type IV secretory pathway VirJ component